MLLAAPQYTVTRRIFLRFLSLIYFFAFFSLATQIVGLVGQNGILPAVDYLSLVQKYFGNQAYAQLPHLFWLNSSDVFLRAVCYAGAAISCLTFFGVAPGLLFAALWFLYLSLFRVGQVFLGFQWDILLLETGFLAIFFAPGILRGNEKKLKPPPRLVLWLFWWLVFRLMFSSGLVKFASGDEAWRNLTALLYHYETQPLPAWTSWYAHHWPAWFQKASALFMFFVELVAPWFIFLGRRMRAAAAAIFVLFQLLIMATGNYCFFNLLTIALSLTLLEDRYWPRLMRRRVEEKPADTRLGGVVSVVVFIPMLVLSTNSFLSGRPFHWRDKNFLSALRKADSALQLTGSYGLFAVMTTQRPEIVMEGSRDGENWEAYEFKHKPGALDRRPEFVAPHQPRLDWQMWFAALGRAEQNRWFVHLAVRLLEGSPEVLNLLAHNPFGDKPPKFIRAVLYDYHFTDAETRKRTGQWWRRERPGLYLSPRQIPG